MISTSDFRKGLVFKQENRLVKILDFQHVKPGKGGAFVRTKFKDLVTGQVLTKTFRSGEKVEDVFIEKKTMQFLYNDGAEYHFMDNATYEQVAFSAQQIGDTVNYLKENVEVQVQFHESNPIGIEPPQTMELEVIETEPGFKGDTVTGATKPATLETGLKVQVPLFVEVGDIVKIDTREDKYLSRA